MKKLLLIGALLAVACDKKEQKKSPPPDTPCGEHQGQQLYRDSQGACYLINSSGNKVYVESKECSC